MGYLQPVACEGQATCDEAVVFFSLEALDKEGFIRVMKKVLSSMSEEKLEVLFLKVDSNCNGYVTWVRRVPCCHRKVGKARRSVEQAEA